MTAGYAIAYHCVERVKNQQVKRRVDKKNGGRKRRESCTADVKLIQM